MEKKQQKKASFKRPFAAPTKNKTDSDGQAEVNLEKEKVRLQKSKKDDVNPVEMGPDGDKSKTSSKTVKKKKMMATVNPQNTDGSEKLSNLVQKADPKSSEVGSEDHKQDKDRSLPVINERKLKPAVDVQNANAGPEEAKVLEVKYEESDDDNEKCEKDNVLNLKESLEEQKRKQDSSEVRRLPIRSLTDEEYEDIFTCAIHRVMDTPLDELLEAMHKAPKIAKKPASKDSTKPLLSADLKVKKAYKSTKHEEVMQKKMKAPKSKEKKSCKSSCTSDTTKQGKPSQSAENVGLTDNPRAEGTESLESQSACLDSTENTNLAEQGQVYEFQDETSLACRDLQVDEQTTECDDEVGREKTTDTKLTNNVASPEARKKKQRMAPVNKIPHLSVKLAVKDISAQKRKKRADRSHAAKDEVSKKRRSEDLTEKQKGLTEHQHTMGTAASSKKQSKKKVMLERDINLYGTWVQCCDKSCNKWRYLRDIEDPSVLPEKWFCRMNNDAEHDSCDRPEENYDESSHIFTRFSEGSIVWAKMAGYPWWPAMVEMDPDSEYFFSLESTDSMHPSHYHVVFLDDKVSRAWIRVANIQPFIGKENLDSLCITKMTKGQSFTKDIEAAKRKALEAVKLSPMDRLQKYSFGKTFTGKWGTTMLEKDLQEKEDRKKKKDVKKKKYRGLGKAPKVEIINNTTVDDLINCTDSSVLKGLEDALESIESDMLTEGSELLDSNDLDSDWEAEENVKSRETESREERSQRRRAKRKVVSPIYSSEEDSDAEITSRKKKQNHQVSKSAEKEEEDSSSEDQEEPVLNEPIKFDPQIFTMEMTPESNDLQNQADPLVEDIKIETDEEVHIQQEILEDMLDKAEREILCEVLVHSVRVEQNNNIVSFDEESHVDHSNPDVADGDETQVPDMKHKPIPAKDEANGKSKKDKKDKEARERSGKKKAVKAEEDEKKETKKKRNKKTTEAKTGGSEAVTERSSEDCTVLERSSEDCTVLERGSEDCTVPDVYDLKNQTGIDTSTTHCEERVKPTEKKKKVKKAFKAPSTQSKSEDTMVKDGDDAKPPTNLSLPVSPRIGDTASFLPILTDADIQEAKLVPEQTVPDTLENDPSHHHDGHDLSMEPDDDLVNKHEGQDQFEGQGEILAVHVGPLDDEDSDPFELIEE